MGTLQSELIEKGLSDACTSEVELKSKAKGKSSERLSDRELRELMGEYRPTFARKKGGAYKQR